MCEQPPCGEGGGGVVPLSYCFPMFSLKKWEEMRGCKALIKNFFFVHTIGR